MESVIEYFAAKQKTRTRRSKPLKEKKTKEESVVPVPKEQKPVEPKLVMFFMDFESMNKIDTGTSKVMLVVKNGKHEIGIAVDTASSTIEFASFNQKDILRTKVNLQQIVGFIKDTPVSE